MNRRESFKKLAYIWGLALFTSIMAIVIQYEPIKEEAPPDPSIYTKYIRDQKAKNKITKSIPKDHYTKPLELVAKDGRRYELDISPEDLLQYYDIDIEDLKEYLGDELR